MLKVVCIAALLGLFGPEAKSQLAPEPSPQSTPQPAEQRGTEQAPLIIKIVPSPETQDKPKPATRREKK
jgi:hypothetical protein